MDKLRVFYNHPGFVEAMTDRVREALAQFTPGEISCCTSGVPRRTAFRARWPKPAIMKSNCARLRGWWAKRLDYRIGSWCIKAAADAPGQPWLEPDILDHLRKLHSGGVKNVIVAPLGFISDHLEVLYDLDHRSAELAQELGMKMVRAGTAGTHPAFLGMLRQLIAERLLSGSAQARDRHLSALITTFVR